MPSPADKFMSSKYFLIQVMWSHRAVCCWIQVVFYNCAVLSDFHTAQLLREWVSHGDADVPVCGSSSPHAPWCAMDAAADPGEAEGAVVELEMSVTLQLESDSCFEVSGPMNPNLKKAKTLLQTEWQFH